MLQTGQPVVASVSVKQQACWLLTGMTHSLGLRSPLTVKFPATLWSELGGCSSGMASLCLQKPFGALTVGEDVFLHLLHSSLTRVFHSWLCVFSYLFHSGNQEHPGDILMNTTVDVLPLKVWLCCG